MTSIMKKNELDAKKYSLRIALFCSVVGVLVLIGGWGFDIAILRTLLPNLVAMKANTAFAFALAGLSLSLYHSQLPTWIAKTCNCALIFLGLLTLAEYFLNINLGIDELLFLDPQGDKPQGRMAVMSAFNIVLVAIALFHLNTVTVKGWRLANSLAFIVLINAFIVMLGYLYDVIALYRVSGYSPMALHTAILFFLLAIAIIGSRPDIGFMRIMMKEDSAGLLVRRLLPAVLFWPPILGWMVLKGVYNNTYGVNFGMALFASGNIAAFSMLIWWVATAIQSANIEKEKAQELSSWQQAILNSADLTIISIDLNGIILTCNAGALRQLGYQTSEIIGKVTPAIFHNPTEILVRAKELSIELGREIAPTFEVFSAKAKEGGIDESEWTYIRKDGSQLSVRLSTTSLHNEVGQLTGFLCISRDISQRKQHEQKIAQQQKELNDAYQRNQAILDYANYSIISTDVQGVINTFNRGAESLLGYRCVEVVNQTTPATFHLPEEVVLRAQALSAELNVTITPSFEAFVAKTRLGLVDENEWTYVRKDGSHVPVLLSVTAQYDTQGSIVGYLGIASDISERKRIERMKNEFVSTVSHELRTPLTSIRGALGLILAKSSAGMSDKAKLLLETANRNCERLTLLINDILDLEKIESGMLAFNIAPMDLADVVQQSLVSNEGYAQKHAVKLLIADTVTVANIIGDEHRLSQVLSNLLSNAIKYSPENGVVEVAIAQDSGQVRVSIKDHGTGIPEDFRQRLFQRFAQADGSDTKAKGGTGLGLSISKAIVERHGGTIGYHSQEGVGTEFYFQLPLVQDHQTIESLNSHRSSVLICEDDMETATILAHMLESEGIASDIALTANAAKQLLTINHYQTLLLDLTLPDMDCLLLIAELRDDKVLQHLPIIVVSGRADEGQQIMDGRADNVIDWLQKPIVQERLVRSLKQTSHRKNKPCLLHIEDDRDLAQITRTLVEGIADYTCALTLEDARLLLAKEQFDVILLDLYLPDGSGLELMDIIRQQTAQVIVFSGHELSTIDRDGITTVLTKAKTSNDQLLKAIKNIID